jgi:hypothetical protein
VTDQQPPRFATWLLLRFASASRRDALAGDLHERFGHGESRWWYWRQVLTAVLAETLEDIGSHKALTGGTVTLVWIIMIAWVQGTWSVYATATARWPILNQSTFWLWYGGGLQLIWCVGAGVTGWVVARLAGRHSATMICVALVALCPLTLWWGGPWLIRSFGTYHLYRLPQQVFALTVLLGMPIALVMGGLLEKRAKVPCDYHYPLNPSGDR